MKLSSRIVFEWRGVTKMKNTFSAPNAPKSNTFFGVEGAVFVKSYASTHSNRLYRFLNPNDRKITIILPKFSLIGPFHNSVCRRFRNSHKGNMTQNIRLRIRSCMTQKKELRIRPCQDIHFIKYPERHRTFFPYPAMQNTESKFRIRSYILCME